MNNWLYLGIMAYLSYAISTSIDKYMMINRYSVLMTSTYKMFFNGIILFSLGIFLFNIHITTDLVIWSLILGIIYAFAEILYYTSLRLRDVGQMMPSLQSSEILLIFVGSILLFDEFVTNLNYLGIVMILIGIYLVLIEGSLKVPKIDKAFFLILIVVILDVIYWLLVKKLLFNIEPINLAITMYFSTTLILVIYQLLFKRQSLYSLLYSKAKVVRIIIASIFGALGTFLLYSAVSLGNASKVYPMAGLQSVFIFIIASIFLKERLYLDFGHFK